MSTTHKLWLGFGLLFVLLITTGLFVAHRLTAIGRALSTIIAVREPASAATYEMQVNVLGTGLAVLEYVHTGDPAQRTRAAADFASFERFGIAYGRMARSAAARALGPRIDEAYRSFRSFADSLMDLSDRQRERFKAFARKGEAVAASADALVANADSKGRDADRRLREIAILRAASDGVGVAAGDYARTHEARHKERLAQAERSFQETLARYHDLRPGSEDRLRAAVVSARFAEYSRMAEELAALDETMQRLLRQFPERREKVESLLDEGIQALARNDLLVAQRSARWAIQTSLFAVLILLAAGILIGSATALPTGRSIVRTENRLREQREQLRVTLANIGDAIIVTDAGGTVTFLNPMARSMLGIEEGKGAGEPLDRIFVARDEETGAATENPVRAASRHGGTGGRTTQALLATRRWGEIPIEQYAAPMWDGDRHLAGVVLVFRDIRERLRLERALKERMKELAIAHRRKDEFLGVLSHELRNPLAPLSNALYVLEAGGAGLPDEVRRAHAMMRRQVQNITRLVDDLLDVSRINEGKIVLHREPTDLAAPIGEAAEGARRAIDERGHRFSVTLPRPSVWVDGDAVRLVQIVTNLLSNAVRYTPDGGRIDLSLAREGEEAVLRVRDTGLGIPPEMLSRVFEPFVQADSSLTREQGGLGIGLTLVQRLVEMHGGTVQALSLGLGQGSTFTVRLPAIEPVPKSEAPAAPLVEPAPVPRLRILVVDDSQESAWTLAELLRLWGHDADVAYDGPSTLDAVAAQSPDLVLLDIALPGMGGYEVARRLRKLPAGEKMRLVAVTGFGQEEDRHRAHEAGFDEHVTKPVSPDALRALLARAAALA